MSTTTTLLDDIRSRYEGSPGRIVFDAGTLKETWYEGTLRVEGGGHIVRFMLEWGERMTMQINPEDPRFTLLGKEGS